MRTFVLDDNYELQEVYKNARDKFRRFAIEFNTKRGYDGNCNPIIGRYQDSDCVVSTIMLPFDYGWYSDDPLIFETMIFGGEHDGYQKRYSSYADAVRGHEEAVKMAEKYI